MDILKLLVALGLIVASIAGFYVYEDQAVWIRLLGMLVMIAVAMFVVVQTKIGGGFWRFATDARTEVRKVVWPTRQETLQTLLIIAIAVLITSLFLWAVDSLLFTIVRYVTGQG